MGHGPEEIYVRTKAEGSRRLSRPFLELAATAFVAGLDVVFGLIALATAHHVVAARDGRLVRRVRWADEVADYSASPGTDAFGTGWRRAAVGARLSSQPNKGERSVSIISWLVLGLTVGVLANWLVPGRFPGGIFGTILGGAIGAFLGGALFTLTFSRGVTGIDPGSLVIAIAGAAGLLALLRIAGHAEPEPRFERRRRP